MSGSIFRLEANSAEFLIINELRNGWIIAADRALGIASQLQFTELHVQRIIQHQAIDQGRTFTEGQLQDFRGLNAADDAGQHTQHAAFRATGHHPRRWWLRIQAAIAGPAQRWSKHASLSFESEN